MDKLMAIARNIKKLLSPSPEHQTVDPRLFARQDGINPGSKVIELTPFVAPSKKEVADSAIRRIVNDALRQVKTTDSAANRAVEVTHIPDLRAVAGDIIQTHNVGINKERGMRSTRHSGLRYGGFIASALPWSFDPIALIQRGDLSQPNALAIFLDRPAELFGGGLKSIAGLVEPITQGTGHDLAPEAQAGNTLAHIEDGDVTHASLFGLNSDGSTQSLHINLNLFRGEEGPANLDRIVNGLQNSSPMTRWMGLFTSAHEAARLSVWGSSGGKTAKQQQTDYRAMLELLTADASDEVVSHQDAHTIRDNMAASIQLLNAGVLLIEPADVVPVPSVKINIAAAPPVVVSAPSVKINTAVASGKNKENFVAKKKKISAAVSDADKPSQGIADTLDGLLTQANTLLGKANATNTLSKYTTSRSYLKTLLGNIKDTLNSNKRNLPDEQYKALVKRRSDLLLGARALPVNGHAGIREKEKEKEETTGLAILFNQLKRATHEPTLDLAEANRASRELMRYMEDHPAAKLSSPQHQKMIQIDAVLALRNQAEDALTGSEARLQRISDQAVFNGIFLGMAAGMTGLVTSSAPVYSGFISTGEAFAQAMVARRTSDVVTHQQQGGEMIDGMVRFHEALVTQLAEGGASDVVAAEQGGALIQVLAEAHDALVMQRVTHGVSEELARQQASEVTSQVVNLLQKAVSDANGYLYFSYDDSEGQPRVVSMVLRELLSSPNRAHDMLRDVLFLQLEARSTGRLVFGVVAPLQLAMIEMAHQHVPALDHGTGADMNQRIQAIMNQGQLIMDRGLVLDDSSLALVLGQGNGLTTRASAAMGADIQRRTAELAAALPAHGALRADELMSLVRLMETYALAHRVLFFAEAGVYRPGRISASPTEAAVSLRAVASIPRSIVAGALDEVDDAAAEEVVEVPAPVEAVIVKRQPVSLRPKATPPLNQKLIDEKMMTFHTLVAGIDKLTNTPGLKNEQHKLAISSLVQSLGGAAKTFQVNPTDAAFVVLKAHCISEIKAAETAFSKESGIWHNVLKPLLNGIMSALNALAKLMFVPKSYQFTMFKTVAETAWDKSQIKSKLLGEHEVKGLLDENGPLAEGIKAASFGA